MWGGGCGGVWGGVTPPHLWPKIAKSRSKIHSKLWKSRSHKPASRCVMSSKYTSFILAFYFDFGETRIENIAQINSFFATG